MAWKPIESAPRDGTLLDLGHVGYGYVERGRWGVHRFSGKYRWVDGNGLGLFDATHWDYLREPPKEKRVKLVVTDIGRPTDGNS